MFPFILTREEPRIADEIASSIRPPLGFRLKPSPFITKPESLKSHDFKQIASQGIFKCCIRCLLDERCRDTILKVFDSISDMCKESQEVYEIDTLEVNLNRASVLLERDFPLSLGNITTHLLHHIPDNIRSFCPVYGTWMYVFERFN